MSTAIKRCEGKAKSWRSYRVLRLSGGEKCRLFLARSFDDGDPLHGFEEPEREDIRLSDQRHVLFVVDHIHIGNRRGEKLPAVGTVESGNAMKNRCASSLHFSPRGEVKWVRGPPGRGASRLVRAGVLDSTSSTASKRNK